MSNVKPSLSGHVNEKPNLGNTEKELDFNESIYSTWAKMTDQVQMTNGKQMNFPSLPPIA